MRIQNYSCKFFVIDILQSYIEQYIHSLLVKANEITMYSNRVKVSKSDLEMVLKLQKN